MELINLESFDSDFKIEKLRVLAQDNSSSPIWGLWNGKYVNFSVDSFKFNQELTYKLELYASLHNELKRNLDDNSYPIVPLKKVQELGKECQLGVALWLLNNECNIKLEERDDFINIVGLTGVVDDEWKDTKKEPPIRGGAYWCWLGSEKPNICQQRVQIYDEKFGWNDGSVTHYRQIPLNPDGTAIWDRGC